MSSNDGETTNSDDINDTQIIDNRNFLWEDNKNIYLHMSSDFTLSSIKLYFTKTLDLSSHSGKYKVYSPKGHVDWNFIYSFEENSLLLYTEKENSLENHELYPTLLFSLKESNTLVKVSDMFDNELRQIEPYKLEIISLTYPKLFVYTDDTSKNVIVETTSNFEFASLQIYFETDISYNSDDQEINKSVIYLYDWNFIHNPIRNSIFFYTTIVNSYSSLYAPTLFFAMNVPNRIVGLKDITENNSGIQNVLEGVAYIGTRDDYENVVTLLTKLTNDTLLSIKRDMNVNVSDDKQDNSELHIKIDGPIYGNINIINSKTIGENNCTNIWTESDNAKASEGSQIENGAKYSHCNRCSQPQCGSDSDHCQYCCHHTHQYKCPFLLQPLPDESENVIVYISQFDQIASIDKTAGFLGVKEPYPTDIDFVLSTSISIDDVFNIFQMKLLGDNVDSENVIARFNTLPELLPATYDELENKGSENPPHEFLKKLALEIFGSISAVDLFSNEYALSLAYKNAVTKCLSIVNNYPNSSVKLNEGEMVIVENDEDSSNDEDTKTSGRAAFHVLLSILRQKPSRFNDIKYTDLYVPIPLRPNDKLQTVFTINSNPNQTDLLSQPVFISQRVLIDITITDEYFGDGNSNESA